MVITVVVDGEGEHVAGLGVVGHVPAHHPILAAVDELIRVVGQLTDADAVRVAARHAERQATDVKLAGLGDLHHVPLADLQGPFGESVALKEGRRQSGAHARHAVLHADHHVFALPHQTQRFHVVRGLNVLVVLVLLLLLLLVS